MKEIDQVIETRFWNTVEVGSRTDCWDWKGYIGSTGYGQVWRTLKRCGLSNKAHRWAWYLKNGPILDNMCVLHKCDNRKCVNPNHLFLGTAKDNAQDCTKKGRYALGYGENHLNSKLTAQQVMDMRDRYDAGGVTFAQLGREYRIHEVTARNIIRRKHWTSSYSLEAKRKQ